MATKSKSSSTKKTTKAASTKRTTSHPKSHPKHTNSTSSHSVEKQVASSALKFIDEAASLLRKGVLASSDTTERARATARKRAHGLLNKAQSHLSQAIENSTDALHKIVKKL